jgi:hypothetical protein
VQFFFKNKFQKNLFLSDQTNNLRFFQKKTAFSHKIPSDSMKKYVQQLIADIRAAQLETEPSNDFPGNRHKRLPFDDDDDEDFNIIRHFEEVEDYVAGRGERKPLVDFVGLTIEAFPPSDKLTDLEMAGIVNAMLKTLFSHGISFDLPENAPPKFNYELLISQLSEETIVPKAGTGMIVGIDFCTGNPEGCELKEFCNCLSFDKNSEEDDLNWGESNDFSKKELSKRAEKLLKSLIKAGKKGRKDGTFTISIKNRYEPLSKKAKPIYKWLGINLDDFNDYYLWDKQELNLILQAVRMGFPAMDWSWLDYTEDADAFDMTTALLQVRADFHRNGEFFTPRHEIFWFLQLSDRMKFKQIMRNRDDVDLPF